VRRAGYLVVGLVSVAAVFAVGLLIGLSNDGEGRASLDGTEISTVTVTSTATTTVEETASDAFSLESGQFVELIQICFAIRNGRLPGPDNPIATPPAMTQEVLDSTIANCRPRQR
jgi:hypothetical protein